jgi:UDP-N-acetylmuramoylalanine--D-glutamate ligase
VVVNPAVRPGDRFLRIARQGGARLTSEVELFLEACPARVIGVTGSNGKSTTAAMTAAILEADRRRVWLGGNIGTSLLDRLDAVQPVDWVVLELSSFQLWHLSPGARVPEVAVVTNCSPNHLDWHPNYAHYKAAKQRMLVGQRPDDLAVLGDDDPETASWAPLVRGRRVPLPPESAIPPLAIPGEHNRRNARCAAAAAKAVGCSSAAIDRALAAFSALPQRLEPIGEVSGRRFYNDSSATTPGATIAALAAIDGRVWLLAGGSDKGVDLRPLAAAIARHACGAALYGAVGARIRRQVTAEAPGFACTAVETLGEALRWCWDRSHADDAVVLSPGCASHDQFRNYHARGEAFVRMVRALSAPAK